VGTLEAYYEAHIDLCGLLPALNLYNPRWPIRTASYPDPGAKFTFDEDGRAGQALGSVISGGCILCGGSVRNSIIGRCGLVQSGAVVEDSVILDHCNIGRHARIRRAILDEAVTVPDDRLRPGTRSPTLLRHRRRHCCRRKPVTGEGVDAVGLIARSRPDGRGLVNAESDGLPSILFGDN
jgi:ADP-glucose pyrophosphorylase